MNITKAQWVTNGNDMSLRMPLQKVNKERRTVSGFATLDNVDTQGDIVTAEASMRAFSKSRARIREQHSKDAVGTIVDFKEDSYYDPETKEFYQGVFVTAYVSKGAPNTWEKVLDGTLSGFSIGGSVKDVEKVFKGDKTINVIKEYELIELSLVDNPANQLANIFSIQKVNGADVLEGEITKIEVETVFYCTKDELAKASSAEGESCPACGEEMANIGWAEDQESVANIVNNFKEKVVTTRALGHNNNEGGVHVANEELEHGTNEVEVSADNVQEVVVDNATDEDLNPVVEEVVGEVKTHDADEVHSASDVDEEIEKQLTAFSDKLEKVAADLKDHVSEQMKLVENKVNELVGQHDSLTEKFSALKSELSTIEKRVDGVEDETAVKKSNDLGGSEEGSTLTKSQESSFWGGNLNPKTIQKFSLNSLE
jgi:hypothetical protein